MDIGGKRTIHARAKLISITAVGFALLTLMTIWALTPPSTDDATIDADIVHVAPAVGGKIIKLAVRENAQVHKGDLLFQIDPLPYRLAFEQATANLDIARAALETQNRVLATQHSNVTIAGEQTKLAQTNYALSKRTAGRLAPLTASGYVPLQQLDQAEAARNDAAVGIRQAEEQVRAAQHAVDTDAAARAGVSAAEAALAIARRAVDDTTVRATHDGLVVGLSISTGETVLPSQAVFTLVNTENWFAVANLREGDLSAIGIGDCATVFSRLGESHPLKGTVDGLGWGVLTDDRINLPRSAPYVEPSLNWVRVAQRFPVRVRLENPPPQLVRLGAGAIVEIRHGAACR